MTIPETRSGRRAASTRAKTPPRLWPMIATRSPEASAKPSRRASSRSRFSSRAADVGADPGAARVVAVLAQPARHRRQRPVAGQEAGDQQHRASLAVGHAAAPPDRAAEQRGRLDTGAAFAPERGEMRDGDAHVHFVPDLTAQHHSRTGSSLASMRAATIRDGRIEVADHPDPEPQDGQILVRVRGAGLNGADMLQVAGDYPAPPGVPPDIPGLEIAGEVVSCGRRVGRFEIGDRVMAIVAGGGQAELAVVHERTAMPVPDELDWTAAGGVPEVFTTAHDALFTQAGLMCGERLLVHGAAGGVGMAAVQLGVMTGARVTATVRNEHAREPDRRARRQRDRPRGLRRGGRVRRDPRARRRARTSPRTSTRWRSAGGSAIIGVGAGAEDRDQPAQADDQARPDPRLDAARRGRSRRRRSPRG